MRNTVQPNLWEWIDLCGERIDGATALHLAIGRPPMVRTADRELLPLGDEFPVLGFREITMMLQRVVEPERWDALERMGEGEVRLAPPGDGRAVTMTLFRSSEAWQVVVHF